MMYDMYNYVAMYVKYGVYYDDDNCWLWWCMIDDKMYAMMRTMLMYDTYDVVCLCGDNVYYDADDDDVWQLWGCMCVCMFLYLRIMMIMYVDYDDVWTYHENAVKYNDDKYV